MPHRKSLALNWRRLPERYRLEANRCTTCNTPFFPPRMTCPACRRRGNLVPLQLSGEGEVFSHTTIHVAPEGFEYGAPYVVAVVKLKEGPLITGQVTDVAPEEVGIGMPVRAAFRRITEDSEDGIIHYSFKFVQAQEKPQPRAAEARPAAQEE
jgi:uncharacterized OB-fold protein